MGDGKLVVKDLLLLLVLACLWGSSYTFIKIGVETIPPITFIAVRTLIAGLILLAVMAWQGISLPRDPRVWRQFLFQAVMNSALPFTLVAWGEQSIGAGLATILNSTTPIFTFLVTALITRHEPVTARKLFGVVAGLIGICLIIGVEALNGLGDQLLAQIAVVAATVSYAGAAVYGKNFNGLHPVLPAAGSMLWGAVLLLPISLIVDRPWTLTPSAPSLWSLVILAVFATAIAYSIYFRLMQTLGSIGTTSQAYLRVPIGVGLGLVFLDETLSQTALIGLICVVSAVVAMTLPGRAKT